MNRKELVRTINILFAVCIASLAGEAYLAIYHPDDAFSLALGAASFMLAYGTLVAIMVLFA